MPCHTKYGFQIKAEASFTSRNVSNLYKREFCSHGLLCINCCFEGWHLFVACNMNFIAKSLKLWVRQDSILSLNVSAATNPIFHKTRMTSVSLFYGMKKSRFFCFVFFKQHISGLQVNWWSGPIQLYFAVPQSWEGC